MSPAKVPQNEAIDETLLAADFADILAATLAMAPEAGLSVGVRNREADGNRPAGLLIYISGLQVDPAGRITEGDPTS